MRPNLYLKGLLTFLFALSVLLKTNAQNANSYTFASSNGTTLDPMTGATTIVSAGVDDTPSGIQSIGFNFVYEGITYSQFSASPDGFMKLGTPAASAQFSNSIVSTTNIPKLFPLWDDLATGAGGSVSFIVTGTAPNRILKIQWFVTVPRNTSGSANSTMQAWLYETTNVIEFRYGTGGTPSNASIGINGTTSTNFISVTTPANTTSTATANNSNNSWPGNGTIYTFTPPAPCTAPPLGGTTAASSSPACANVNFNLSVTGGAIGSGLSYQWESSPDGSTWSPIVGATNPGLTTSQTVATWYHRKTTCSAQDAYSTSLQVTMNPPSSCYCTVLFPSNVEPITLVNFGTINNVTSATLNGTPALEDFTSISTNVLKSQSYTITVKGNTDGGFTDYIDVYIDWNQDGDFLDGGENYFIGTIFGSTGADGIQVTGSIPVPLSALDGNTVMRVIKKWNSSATACNTTGFGQAEDYTLNVSTPPCLITCPANITVNNAPGQCGAIVNYPAPTTVGVCGPITTSPASGSFFPMGTTTVTASEAGGGTCSFTVTVVDAELPTITCPANISVNNSPGQCGAIVNFPAPTITDNCPGAFVVSSPASGSLFPSGTTTVTSTVTDAGGNTVSCTFTVTVTDTENPTINCPPNINVSNDAGVCGAIVNYALPSISDNCSLPGDVALSQTTANSVGPAIQIGCQNGGFTTDNSYWRAYNLSAYGLSGPLTIKTATFGIETANANGSGTTQPITVRLYTSAGAFPASGRTLIASETVQVPDQSNTLYTITFSTPPTVPANSIIAVEVFSPDGRPPVNNTFFIGSNNLGQTGPCYISAADCGAPTPTDLASLGFPDMHIVLNIGGTISGANPLTFVSGIPSGGTFPIGTTTNTFMVTDVAGNTASCSFDVTVNDTELPVITCPGNITLTTALGSCTAVANYTVTSTDNCAGVTQALKSGLASGSAFPIGVNTVTWEATDAAGNKNTCSFTVTVIDGQLPVISLQPASKTVCVGSNVAFKVTATNVLTYQWQSFNGTSWNNITGATTSTYTVNNVTTAMNTNSYRVVMTGLCTIVTSNHASIYVNTLPVVKLTVGPNAILLPNQTTMISSTTNPSGGSYVWSLNGSGIPASSANLTKLGIDDIGTYMLVYTDPNGCVSSSSIQINAAPSAGVWVYPSPNKGDFQVRYYNAVNEPATINIYDSKGTRVYQKGFVTSIPYSSIGIHLSNAISTGVYLVEIVNGSGKKIGSKRILVQQ